MTGRSPRRLAALALTSLALLASCSSGPSGTSGAPTTTGASGGTTTGTGAPGSTGAPRERPAGPAADLSEEITAAGRPFLADLSAVDLAAAGYVEREYVAAGTATNYVAAGELGRDGRWTLEPGPTAPYRTRIVVRRPTDTARFSGTVVVEWLNVSGGLDSNPDWGMLSDELLRQGHAWVGVSAQHIGVEGGEVAVPVPMAGDLAGKGLKKMNPERYASLQHPGDGFSYDMYTQIARALRTEDGGGVLEGLDVEQLLAVGESQSGFALTTYVNGFQPMARQFDGFLIHSRGGPALPLGGPGEAVSIVSSITGTPVEVRSDLDVPVLTFITETDLLSVINYYPARQPDTDRFRLWEVAGTAHVDRGFLGPVADAVDCGVAINDGPQRFALRAALRHLDRWVRTGQVPPEAPRLEVDTSGEKPLMGRGVDGIALGGIRLPQVEAPVAVLSGDPGPSGGVICMLMGSTMPFTPAQLASRYPSRAAYLEAYERAADASVAAGFVLPEDLPALLDDAEPDLLAS